MNKLLSLLSVGIFLFSACDSNEPAAKIPGVQPGSKLSLSDDQVVKPSKKPDEAKPVDSGNRGPEFGPSKVEQNDTNDSKAQQQTDNTAITIVGDEGAPKSNNQTETQLAVLVSQKIPFAWNEEGQEKQVRVLNEDELANLNTFDFAPHLLLDCELVGKEVLHKVLVATKAYLADKKIEDGYGWTQVIEYEQTVGTFDFSFPGIWNRLMGNKLKKTETIDIVCQEKLVQ